MKKFKKLIGAVLIAGFMLPQIALGSSSEAEAASGKWKQDKKGWYYSYSDGSYAKNTWLKIGGKWFYFGANGYMTKGWKQIGKKWYYFGADGKMRSGWQKIGGKWYYFASGAMKTGWLKSGGKWFYFNGDGSMVTGTKTIGGKKFTFDKNGVLQDLSATEVFKKETVYFAPLDEEYYALFLHIKGDSTFYVGTYDEILGGNEPKGKIINLVKTRATAYDMEMSAITGANWIKNGTKVHLYKSGTGISSIPTKYFTNGKNTDYTFGKNIYAFGKSWKEMTKLPKDTVYLELEGGGYWFIIKE